MGYISKLPQKNCYQLHVLWELSHCLQALLQHYTIVTLTKTTPRKYSRQKLTRTSSSPEPDKMPAVPKKKYCHTYTKLYLFYDTLSVPLSVANYTLFRESERYVPEVTLLLTSRNARELTSAVVGGCHQCHQTARNGCFTS